MSGGLSMSILKIIFAYIICLFVSKEAAESVNAAETPADLDAEILRRNGFDRGP